MKIDFAKYTDGLVPAIIQDSRTNKVLMLGFMNREALETTETTGMVTFFSRSRQKLWTKGETSGNYLRLQEISADCDSDTILVRAVPSGPVCHTGADTCFDDVNESENFLFELEKTIVRRKTDPVEGSYTARLFAKGINKIAQKVGEEAVELVIEAKDDDDELFKNEAADLLYHFVVLLAAKEIPLADVMDVLRQRKK